MGSNLKSLILVVVLFILFNENLNAQCAMCRLMAESSYAGGSDVGRGLNDGITYIMGVPYVLLAIGAYVLFKKNFQK